VVLLSESDKCPWKLAFAQLISLENARGDDGDKPEELIPRGFGWRQEVKTQGSAYDPRKEVLNMYGL
jgi:hypothetical protein